MLFPTKPLKLRSASTCFLYSDYNNAVATVGFVYEDFLMTQSMIPAFSASHGSKECVADVG